MPNPKITNFNRSNCHEVREAIVKALKPIEDEFGISVNLGTGTFSVDDFRIKLTCEVLSPSGEKKDKNKKNWDLFHKMYGFEKTDFEKEFTFRGDQYKICGISPQSPKFPVLGRKSTGKVFKFVANDIFRKLGREVKERNMAPWE